MQILTKDREVELFKSSASGSISSSLSASETGHSLMWVHGLMILTIAFIASSFPVGKLIADALPADVMMLIRFLMAAILFAPYIVYKHGRKIPPVKRLLKYALLSVPLVTFFWCMFEALKYTSAVNTGALYTTVPALTAIFALVINGEMADARQRWGLAMGTIGALWIVFKGDTNALLNLELNRGDWIFFFGALALSIYSPLVKRLYSGEAMVIMTFWVIVFGAVWMLLLSLPKLSAIQWSEVSLSVFGGLLYLALFTTLLSFFLLQLGTVKIGATKVAAYGFLNPIFVLVIVITMGMAEFNWVLVPGGLLVVMAIFILNGKSRSRVQSCSLP